MKRTFLLLSLLYIATVILTLEIITYAPTKTKIPTSADAQFENEFLLERIQSFAHDKKIEPIDAIVDRVWKAIPGYNGQEIDVKKSYSNMATEEKFDENLLAYREIPPEVHLEDLPPSPIYKGNPEKPMVTLLINVAWGDEFIPTILDTLEKQNVQATFFFDGSWVKKTPDLAKVIYENGHEIGNHAYSHPDLNTFSREATKNELKKTNDVIEESLGITPTWFAPPSGSFNQGTVDVARELGMMTILWTVDTIDWKKPETSAMVSRVVAEVENGSMILMHPTKPVAEGLDQMIRSIKEKGYQLGTASEMMSEKRITKDH